jgi:putative ABC transport system substrate-binding protein
VSSVAALAASSAIAVVPHGARAQQRASPRRIGVLLVGFSPESKEPQQFRRGLQDAGYVEGRDVVIEWRYANGDYARVPELVADLVQSKVDAIVVDSTVTTQVAKRSTSTIPIVMALVADPVGSGLVTNLAHPGGNVTGLSQMTVDLSAKRLQLLKETIPRIARVAVLWNPDTPYHPKVIEDLKAVAPSLSIKLSFVGVRTPEQFGSVLSAVSRARAQALYVIDDPFFDTHRTTISKLASKARLPSTYGQREYVDEGGLMSYGASYADLFRRSAGYVDRILKGMKPGDLPIEQPTKFEFVVNLRTAQAIGLAIPQSVLLQADDVIR